jgi:murein DD-endopeptidase MepM/ murein hydrolase activator NlpD
MDRKWASVVVVVALLPGLTPRPGGAAGQGQVPTREEPTAWSPPVDGPVVRGYQPPERPFGPRHLGLDFAAAPGTAVRAAGDGIVAFAGQVGRARSVAVEHGGARRTTYAYLRRVLVRPGASVHRGDTLGISGGAGPGHRPDVVHFGYRVAGVPRDPAPLFKAAPRISLAPLDRPACPSRPREQPGRPATLSGNPTAPGREYSRPRSIGVRP